MLIDGFAAPRPTRSKPASGFTRRWFPAPARALLRTVSLIYLLPHAIIAAH